MAAVFDVTRKRTAKADRIATVLRQIGATADDVVRFEDGDRRAAEAAAGARKGSDETWRLAIEMLAGSANPNALCPTCGLGDPLGETGPRKRYNHKGRCAR